MKKKPVPQTKIEFETFRKFSSYETVNLKKNEPSCFNGLVEFKKYKVTVEPVEEPVEVYQERLQKMWDECDNFHHWQPLKKAAESVGYSFTNSAGTKRKR